MRSRRRHERVWFTYRAVLELKGGRSLSGVTRDVSLRGLFLTFDTVPEGVSVGDSGVLRLTVANLKKEYSCRVAHVGDQGLGLEIFDRGENFGAALTSSLLQDTQTRLGAEVQFTDYIRVAPRDASIAGSFEGRLIRVSVSHMEFVFPAMSRWTIQPGELLRLEIIQSRQTPLPVEGRVRSVLSAESAGHGRPGEKVCAVVFSGLSARVSSEIAELVRALHARRLRGMISQRATTIGLETGPDQPMRARQQLRRDFERFFGPMP